MKTPNRPTLRRLAAAIALACAGSGAIALAQPAAVPFAVLNTVELPAQQVDGRSLLELSGLAWDADEQLLYAVSDRGSVFHLRLQLDGDKLAAVQPVFGAALRDPSGALRKFNAEGLAVLNANNGIKGDTQLVVALENGPALLRVTPQGEVLAPIELPEVLRDKDRYYSKNKRLEAVAALDGQRFVTAPEAPLAGEDPMRHTLYATDGARWSFQAIEAGSDLKGIDTLADGSLLVLERLEGGGKRARQVVLRRIDPASCAAGKVCSGGGSDGVAPVDGNFEGLARLSERTFVLVSDSGAERSGATTFALIRLGTP